jgi:hypothetical protein
MRVPVEKKAASPYSPSSTALLPANVAPLAPNAITPVPAKPRTVNPLTVTSRT